MMLILELLKVICDNWRAKDGTELPVENPSGEQQDGLRLRTISKDDIVNKFGSEKIRRILKACLVMDRVAC